MSENWKTFQEWLDADETEKLRLIVDDCLKRNPNDLEPLFYLWVLLQDAKDEKSWNVFSNWLDITAKIHNMSMEKVVIGLIMKLGSINRTLNVSKEVIGNVHDKYEDEWKMRN